MNKNKIKQLLQSSLNEIDNLQKKIANKEEEGWEGSKRRLLLKNDLQEMVKLLNYEVT